MSTIITIRIPTPPQVFPHEILTHIAKYTNRPIDVVNLMKTCHSLHLEPSLKARRKWFRQCRIIKRRIWNMTYGVD